MARATQPRNTRKYGPGMKPEVIPAKVPAGQMVYAGTLVALLTGGAVSAAEAGIESALGRAEWTVDNSTGTAPADIEVRRGVFDWDTDGSLTEADVGKDVFVIDDQTVGAAGDVVAGKLVFVEDGTFWIETPGR